jgi:hypothetical protein
MPQAKEATGHDLSVSASLYHINSKYGHNCSTMCVRVVGRVTLGFSPLTRSHLLTRERERESERDGVGVRGAWGDQQVLPGLQGA